MMDTQLIAEYCLQNDMYCDFHWMLDCLDITNPPSMRLKQRLLPQAELHARRPMAVGTISPVINKLKVLASSYSNIRDRFDYLTWHALVNASNMRAVSSTKGSVSRRVGLHVTRSHANELLLSVIPKNMMIEQPLAVVQDIASLLKIFLFEMPCQR
jgi:hypothetical protein